MMTTRKKNLLIVIIFMLAIICPQICDADQSDQYNDIYTICMAENHKEGVQNEAGEWIIPPIYDGVSFDGYSYWVWFRIKQDEPPLIGVVNFREGFAIPAYYEDILIGDGLIVAYSSLAKVYDIYDMSGRLITMLSGDYEYITPVNENTIEIIDQDLNISYYTIQRCW